MSFFKSDWDKIIEKNKKKAPNKYKNICFQLSKIGFDFEDIYNLIKCPLKFYIFNKTVVYYHKGSYISKNSFYSKYVDAIKTIISKKSPFSEEIKLKLKWEFLEHLSHRQKLIFFNREFIENLSKTEIKILEKNLGRKISRKRYEEKIDKKIIYQHKLKFWNNIIKILVDYFVSKSKNKFLRPACLLTYEILEFLFPDYWEQKFDFRKDPYRVIYKLYKY